MDSLLAGTLILPWRVHCAGCDVQRRSACGNHSGPSRKPFRGRAKTVRLPPGITVRLQPGILFVFTRNRFHVHPGIPFTLPRNPQLVAWERNLRHMGYVTDPNNPNPSEQQIAEWD